MREIKLRGWCEEIKQFIRGDDLILEHSQWCAVFLPDGFDHYHTDTSPVIEQWTGLKDKNGVDIYEGDILRFFFDGEECFSCPVAWVDEGGMWGSHITLNQIIPEDIGVAQCEYEVIGNIHEGKS